MLLASISYAQFALAPILPCSDLPTFIGKWLLLRSEPYRNLCLIDAEPKRKRVPAKGRFTSLAATVRTASVNRASQQLKMNFGIDSCGWLWMRPNSPDDLSRLAAFTGIPENRMPAVVSPTTEPSRKSRHPYCPRCFQLNPLDVSASYWKLDWITQSSALCAIHGTPYLYVSGAVLSRERSMRRLYAHEGRRQRALKQRRLQTLPLIGIELR